MSRLIFREGSTAFSLRGTSSSPNLLGEVVTCVLELAGQECRIEGLSFRLDLDWKGDVTFIIVPRNEDFCVYALKNVLDHDLKERAVKEYPELLDLDWNSRTLELVEEGSSSSYRFYLWKGTSHHHPREDTDLTLDHGTLSDKSPVNEEVTGSSDSKTSREGVMVTTQQQMKDIQVPFQGKRGSIVPEPEELSSVYSAMVSTSDGSSAKNSAAMKFPGTIQLENRVVQSAQPLPPIDELNPLPLEEPHPTTGMAVTGGKSEYVISKSEAINKAIGGSSKEGQCSMSLNGNFNENNYENSTSAHVPSVSAAALPVDGDSVPSNLSSLIFMETGKGGTSDVDQLATNFEDREAINISKNINREAINISKINNSQTRMDESSSATDSLEEYSHRSSMFNAAVGCKDQHEHQHDVEPQHGSRQNDLEQASGGEPVLKDTLIGGRNQEGGISDEPKEISRVLPFESPVAVNEPSVCRARIRKEGDVAGALDDLSESPKIWDGSADNEDIEFLHVDKYLSDPPGTIIYADSSLISLVRGQICSLPNTIKLESLGKGGNGSVYAHEAFGQKYAMKMTKYRCRELNTWKKLKHVNLIRLLAVMIGSQSSYVSHRNCYQFMPFMSGSLRDKLKPHEGLLQWYNHEHISLQLICKNVRYIVKRILKALKYLAENNMQHQDVKESNILVLQVCDCPNIWECCCQAKYLVKLADVDSIKEIVEQVDQRTVPVVGCIVKNSTEYGYLAGTKGYRAPEKLVNPLEFPDSLRRSIIGDYKERNEFTLSGWWSDIWSFGRTIVVLFMGRAACSELIHDANILLKQPTAQKQLSSQNEDVAAVLALIKLITVASENHQCPDFSVIASLACQCMTTDLRSRKTADELLKWLESGDSAI